MKIDHVPEVRAAIVKAVPEILELKPGCLVKHASGVGTIVGRTKNDTDFLVKFSLLDYVGEAYEFGPNWTILGRHITLADVLRTLPPGVYLKTLGEQARLVVDDPDRDEGPVYWDCTADSLDEQSEETIAFLHSILV